MKIYLKTGRRNHLMFITPGTEPDAASEWKNPDGTNKQFTVRFVDGCADVPRGIGIYLVHKKMAQTTRLILPETEARLVVQDERVRRHRVLTADYHA
jgi:hypothetical protein